jgi:hypothetical protein
MSIPCRDCGQAFEFSSLNTLSDDKTEIRLLITEAPPAMGQNEAPICESKSSANKTPPAG